MENVVELNKENKNIRGDVPEKVLFWVPERWSIPSPTGWVCTTTPSFLILKLALWTFCNDK